MNLVFVISAVILLLCILFNKLFSRLGIPSLLIFLVLGMLFGSDGIGGIYFDNYTLASNLCSTGLIFIMFFGGFSTNWNAAKPIAGKAIAMSTVGVLLTALFTGLFCHWVLRLPLLESFLIGSVISSTDAASVFSILRSRKLNLKNNLASLLEVESGSNDPASYMLTMIILSLMQNSGSNSLGLMIVFQVLFGVLFGLLLGFGCSFLLRHVTIQNDGFYPILVTAVALLGYGICGLIDGNGYLCVYLIGIILGNSKISHKKSLVHFFDGISWLMQIMLFFTLGLLSFPSRLPQVAVSGILVSLFLIFIARPLSVVSILSWFRVPLKEQLLISWVGLRGAASIVFAIFAVSYDVSLNQDIFHTVFFVALFSVSVQGTLIPWVARKLDLVGAEESSVFKTFTDYDEESSHRLLEVQINPEHIWYGKTVLEAGIPEENLIVMIQRGEERLIPKGSTEILDGDILVLSGSDFSRLPFFSENNDLNSEVSESQTTKNQS